MDKEKCVILMSGGLDSTTLALMAMDEGMEAYPVFFLYGQKNAYEFTHAQRAADTHGMQPLKVFSVEGVGGSALTDDDWKRDVHDHTGLTPDYVPFRNGWMLALAVGYAEQIGASQIWYGAAVEDNSPDCQMQFVHSMQLAVDMGTKQNRMMVAANPDARPIVIRAPLLEYGMTKEATVRRGIDLGLNYGNTFTCSRPVIASPYAYDYEAQEMACGVCEECQIRKGVFRRLEIEDPTIYASMLKL